MQPAAAGGRTGDRRSPMSGGGTPSAPGSGSSPQRSPSSATRATPAPKAPVTQSFVAGVDRELRSNLAVGVNYTYTKHDAPLGQLHLNITPRVGVNARRTTRRVSALTGTLPDGTAYSVPTYIAERQEGRAGGGGFLTTTIPGYSTDYHGLELRS